MSHLEMGWRTSVEMDAPTTPGCSQSVSRMFQVNVMCVESGQMRTLG